MELLNLFLSLIIGIIGSLIASAILMKFSNAPAPEAVIISDRPPPRDYFLTALAIAFIWSVMPFLLGFAKEILVNGITFNSLLSSGIKLYGYVGRLLGYPVVDGNLLLKISGISSVIITPVTALILHYPSIGLAKFLCWFNGRADYYKAYLTSLFFLSLLAAVLIWAYLFELYK